MKIINFIENQQLWADDMSFASIVADGSRWESSEAVRNYLQNYQLDLAKQINTAVSNEINHHIQAATEIFNQDFDSKDVTLLIAAMSDQNRFVMEQMNGVTGYTFGQSVFMCFNDQAEWGTAFLLTLVHELNHVARMPFYGQDLTFLDWLIFEGLADTYVKEKLPHLSLSPWATALKTDEILVYIPRLESFWSDPYEQGKTDATERQDWFFGNEDKGIPQWLGYAVGFYLVQKFRTQNPELSWMELIKIKSEDFWFRGVNLGFMVFEYAGKGIARPGSDLLSHIRVI